VSCVVHIFNWWSINVWFVEFIQLIMGQMLVIFDTITIFIIDLSLFERSVISGEA